MTASVVNAKALLDRENAGDFPKQKSQAWYDSRYTMLTASEISSVLDNNIYMSSYELMLNKINPLNNNLVNDATTWGNVFEPIACKFYEFLKKEKVHNIGLVKHNLYNWLGASPDGLILSGRLLEIKCPLTRAINNTIPLQYWIQMQIQMEVCDIDECDYLECAFYKYANKTEYDADIIPHIDDKGIFTPVSDNDGSAVDTIYWKLNKCFLKTVNRDKQWFAENIQRMCDFNTKMVFYKEHGTDKLYNDITSRKRKRSVDNVLSMSKKQKSTQTQQVSITDWSQWVSATQIRNYIIDDPLVDWLEYYTNQKKMSYIKYTNGQCLYIDGATIKNPQLDEYLLVNKFNYQVNTNSDFFGNLLTKGSEFESNIVAQLYKTYTTNIVTIASYQQARSHDKYLNTVEHMKQGTPIIYQAVLHDHKTKTYGMPDLLVRSDWLNKLFKKPVMSHKSATHGSKFNRKWHYRVVEIKYSTLHLCADGKHLRNDKTMLPYKGQLYIYNKIIGGIQDYTPFKSYIMGKRWMYLQGSVKHCGDTFDRVAYINFHNVNKDRFIRAKTAKAIKWIRDLRSEGHKWVLFPPTKNELRPNMCNMDPTWQTVKTGIADRQNDITALWMCGPKNRAIADSNGIVNWRKQEVTSEDLGVTGDKVANTLQLIIEYNQDTQYVEPFIPIELLETKDLIYPKKIVNNNFQWKRHTKNTLEFFVDFETVDIISDTSMIFMIGVGHIVDTKWVFKSFCVKTMTMENEGQMLLEFHAYIHDITNTFKKEHPTFKTANLYHWGHAEQSTYTRTMARHDNLIHKDLKITTWCDFLTVFKDEPIVVRGALNFGLKTIVKAMYNNAFINTKWEENKITNGLNAMVYAYQEHLNCLKNPETKLMDASIIQDIVKYNEIDCKVLWEIMTYLREHHI